MIKQRRSKKREGTFFSGVSLFSFLTVLFVSALLISGCSMVDREEQISKRDEGIAHLSKGEYDAAIGSFTEGLGMAKGRVSDYEIDITYYLAAAHSLKQEYTLSIQDYTNLITYDEDNYQAYFLRGCMHFKNEEAEKGIADFNTAMSKNKEDYELYLNIYENLMAYKYEKEAKDALTNALKIEGDEGENYYYRGRIYMLLDQPDVAVTAFERAVGDGYEDAAIYLVQIYMDTDQDEMANDLASVYLDKKDRKEKDYLNAGKILMVMGEYDKALKVFDDAMAYLEDNESDEYKMELTEGYIAALEWNGDLKKAKEEAEKYVALYPADERMRDELVFLGTR